MYPVHSSPYAFTHTHTRTHTWIRNEADRWNNVYARVKSPTKVSHLQNSMKIEWKHLSQPGSQKALWKMQPSSWVSKESEDSANEVLESGTGLTVRRGTACELLSLMWLGHRMHWRSSRRWGRKERLGLSLWSLRAGGGCLNREVKCRLLGM